MVYLSAVAMVNALGNSLDEIAKQLSLGQSGLVFNDQWLLHHKATYIGAVDQALPHIDDSLAIHNTRNNRLLLAALEQIKKQVNEAILRFGKERVAIIMGSSTAGIYEGELAVAEHEQRANLPTRYFYQQQEMADLSIFLAKYLDVTGPAYTLSTACTSSARAIIAGKRLVEAGLVDAALVGGADTLCHLSLNGFNSLEQISNERCTPFARERKGINIGEAASLLLLTRETAEVALLGVGESSDAWHMSAPHPEGRGAVEAMRMALSEAAIEPHQVAYINLHGTATVLNDSMEANAIHQIFGHHAVPCSSTKHLTGHTLGAAGATEIALCWLLLTRGIVLPWQDFSQASRDKELAPFNLLTSPHHFAETPFMLSNSFAFGGNNTSILLGKMA